MTYTPNPTKQDLLDYYSQRIAVRKMHEIEAFRLMDVSDEDIAKIRAYPFPDDSSRQEAIRNADKKELSRIKRESICKTAQYKMAGNSIVVSCLYHILYKLFVDTSTSTPTQLSLFD